MNKIALVAGATGLIGKQLMYKLLEDSHFAKVYILVRKELAIKHPKLEQVITSFDNLEKIHLAQPLTDVFCCLGTTMKKAKSQAAFYKVDFTYTVEVAKFAQKSGAKNCMLVSSVGADSISSVYYTRVKGEVEEAIKNIQFYAFHAFRPSMLMGSRDEFRFGEKLGIGVALLLRPFMFGPLAKYKPIHSAVVANNMLLASLQDKKGNFVYEYADFEPKNT